MNAIQLESKFAAMGARMKVRQAVAALCVTTIQETITPRFGVGSSETLKPEAGQWREWRIWTGQQTCGGAARNNATAFNFTQEVLDELRGTNQFRR